MHDETVETYTNVYARWFAVISQFIVTASLCTLWRLQMTRYSQVLVHSTVVNSQLSHQYMSISPFLWGFTAGFLELFLGFLQFQLLFARSFPAFWLGLGAVLVISAVSTTFSRVFSGFWAGFGVLFWWFLQFQLLFAGSYPAFGLGLGCCFGDFCRNHQNSTPNPAQKPDKTRQKVAETAEITKTAPQTQPKSRKKPEKK